MTISAFCYCNKKLILWYSISDAYPILSAVSVMDVWGLIGVSGVWNNIIFDPPNYQSAIVHHVAAVEYDVNCQALPNAKQSNKVNVTTDNGETSITYPFRVDDRLRDVQFGVGECVWYAARSD